MHVCHLVSYIGFLLFSQVTFLFDLWTIFGAGHWKCDRNCTLHMLFVLLTFCSTSVRNNCHEIPIFAYRSVHLSAVTAGWLRPVANLNYLFKIRRNRIMLAHFILIWMKRRKIRPAAIRMLFPVTDLIVTLLKHFWSKASRFAQAASLSH